MGENERGAGDVADLAGAGGDVLEGAPAAGEQGERGFALLSVLAGPGADPSARVGMEWRITILPGATRTSLTSRRMTR